MTGTDELPTIKLQQRPPSGGLFVLAVPELKPLPVVAALADIPGYLPFQFGVRLLRKASIPSRKSSLI